MHGPFVMRFAVVSGLAALAAVVLPEGLAGSGAALTIVGAVTGVLALAGVLDLARIVIAAERRSREQP